MNSNRTLWDTLNKIQSTLGATDAHYSEMLGLPLARFQNLRRDAKDLPITAITELSKHLPTSFENIALGNVDYQAIEQQLLKGNLEYIPARYLVPPFSKRRNSLHLLYYLEQRHGQDYVKRFLKNFHIDYSIFLKENENISLLFLQDLTAHLLKAGYKRNHFIEIGKASTTTNRGGPLAQAFQSCQSLSEMYLQLVKDFTSHLEGNFIYSIHDVTPTNCVIRSSFKEGTQKALNRKAHGNAQLCWMNLGLLTALPLYRGLPEAKVRKTKCLYDDHSHCEMHMEYVSNKLALLS